MPTPALTFFFAPGSSSMAPHIALHELGVPFESKPVSFARKETRTPEFLAINPEGKVPTLNLLAHYDRMLARPAVIRALEIESTLGYELP